MKRLLLLAASNQQFWLEHRQDLMVTSFTRISRPKTISQLIGLLQMPIMTVRHGNISMRPLLRMQMAVQVWQSIYTKETMQQMII